MVYLKSVENVITLGKLIGLLFLFCLPLLSILFLKTKRNDLARPVMGTIFLVLVIHTKTIVHTVEPLKEDPPRKGHCIKYLSTKDKTKSPNLSLPINIMQLEPLKRGQPL